jgi:undecaprenyl-diphosphatase
MHFFGANAPALSCATTDCTPPMNDLLAALLLGIIEGITEFLPISSTGHLLIAERWLGHRSDLFNIAIQAGAILAVVLIYWQRLLGLLAAAGRDMTAPYDPLGYRISQAGGEYGFKLLVAAAWRRLPGQATGLGVAR